MMRFMKRLLHLGMTMLLLLTLTAATALAAAETATITVNVTNTPVRGDVLLEKTGLQLIRFEDAGYLWQHRHAPGFPKRLSGRRSL